MRGLRRFRIDDKSQAELAIDLIEFSNFGRNLPNPLDQLFERRRFRCDG